MTKSRYIFYFSFLVSATVSVAAAEECVRIYLPAISQIESGGDPRAVSYRGAKYGRGEYQISEVCFKDYLLYHPREKIEIQTLFDPNTSYKIADWYLNSRIPGMLKHYGVPDSIENRLIAYNSGIRRAVSHHKTGAEIPAETVKYIEKYCKLTGKQP